MKPTTKAFEAAFQDHYGALCFFAKKIVGDMDTARDIVQDIFVRLYADRASLQINTSLKSYLFKSVYNRCLNWLSQRKVHSHHHDLLKRELPRSEEDDMVIQAELEEKIRVAVQRLPDQCRKIFILNRFDGKRNNEIAEELNISIRTVETQISKALAMLRVSLAEFLPMLIATAMMI